MPFDPVMSVGHDPKTQPAILTLSETVTTVEQNDHDITRSLTVDSEIQLQFITASVNFEIVSGPAGQNEAFVVLSRNGVEIDRVNWFVTMTQIATGTGKTLLYNFASNRSDIVNQNDVFTLTVHYDDGGDVSATTYNTFLVIELVGTYL